LVTGLTLALTAGTTAYWMVASTPTPPLTASAAASASVPRPSATLEELLTLTPAELSSVDIARMNLVCAFGLRGSEKLDVNASLRQLDAWASQVAAETERYFYQFAEKPEDFNHSEGYFRILMMITVLQQDLGVQYNMARVSNPDFSNAQDVFISGMIGSDNGGTCSSMPMLYTAIARRLGYPVFIVKAKEHLFCRWDGAWRGKPDRFNIEGAGRGMNAYPDDYYRTWPHPILQTEVDRGEYLRSLNPAETFAMCLAARAYVLEDNGDIPGASAMYAEAAKNDPRDAMYPQLASRAARHAKPKVARLPFVPPVDGDPRTLMDFNRRNQERALTTLPTGVQQPAAPIPQPGVIGSEPWAPTPRLDR